ncbi:FAD-dependent oxidoreductase [Thaumasiovibrio subtropicus]|uniref:FAD-dependent oxidoreductase n=1 Tax=Thaumasiovibrio subtropicus TaxID=1891207 RepID=UPI000B357BD9|nr:FAD-dependent oxidoreductase [Thaumasiovibrio subtropicus]
MDYQRMNPFRVGIIGGGIAGATVAMHLAEQGLNVTLFEAGESLVNGPPVCHLHAGGNLYREISDEQCLTLLEQSVATLRQFPHCANVRPTVIAVPVSDPGSPDALAPRLALLEQAYAELIAKDPSNKVMGEAKDYYRFYTRPEMEALQRRQRVEVPQQPDDWMIPFAQTIDLDKLKFPIVLVQEYGLSVFRMASTAELLLAEAPRADVQLNTKVIGLHEQEDSWQVETNKGTQTVDFIINACGYQTGTIDNMIGAARDRMVEYKAAFVSHWPAGSGYWPEIIIHGERGTPQGMAQFTPYADGYFQLHGMTEDITLFKTGLVSSSRSDAQPRLAQGFEEKIAHRWPPSEQRERTERAITHFGQYMPSFNSAEYAGQPLCGAQQIPGDDPTLRAADISFEGKRYARAEIVKASSALTVAEALLSHLKSSSLLMHTNPVALPQPDAKKVEERAMALAMDRGYPASLAKVYSA